MPRGGKRAGSGRKKMPESKKRKMVSIKMTKEGRKLLKLQAADHGLSQGKLVEKFLGLDPEPGDDD